MSEHDGLKILQRPFAPHEISILPKQLSKDDKDKGKCTKGSKYCADDKPCGGYHARSIHLDYVGHAALTKRLLEADPQWHWEPVAMGSDGLPQFDKIGGLWIRLNVCGMSRLGYGDSQGKVGPNAIKEAIGDALRNAAMRFGAALDLWHKGDLYDADEIRGLIGEAEADKSEPKPKPEPRNIHPHAEAKDLKPDELIEVERILERIHELFGKGMEVGAYDFMNSQSLSAEAQSYLKTQLDAAEKKAFRKIYTERSTTKVAA